MAGTWVWDPGLIKSSKASIPRHTCINSLLSAFDCGCNVMRCSKFCYLDVPMMDYASDFVPNKLFSFKLLLLGHLITATGKGRETLSDN